MGLEDTPPERGDAFFELFPLGGNEKKGERAKDNEKEREDGYVLFLANFQLHLSLSFALFLCLLRLLVLNRFLSALSRRAFLSSSLWQRELPRDNFTAGPMLLLLLLTATHYLSCSLLWPFI